MRLFMICFGFSVILSTGATFSFHPVKWLKKQIASTVFGIHDNSLRSPGSTVQYYTRGAAPPPVVELTYDDQQNPILLVSNQPSKPPSLLLPPIAVQMLGLAPDSTQLTPVQEETQVINADGVNEPGQLLSDAVPMGNHPENDDFISTSNVVDTTANVDITPVASSLTELNLPVTTTTHVPSTSTRSQFGQTTTHITQLNSQKTTTILPLDRSASTETVGATNISSVTTMNTVITTTGNSKLTTTKPPLFGLNTTTLSSSNIPEKGVTSPATTPVTLTRNENSSPTAMPTTSSGPITTTEESEYYDDEETTITSAAVSSTNVILPNHDSVSSTGSPIVGRNVDGDAEHFRLLNDLNSLTNTEDRR